MGKSTAADILKRLGLPIYSADKAVHTLLKKGGDAVRPVSRLFPESLKRGAIDRRFLSRSIFSRPKDLKKLEAIIHPLLRRAERDFLIKAKKRRDYAAILEIPLLFETGAEKRCDIVFCVTAPRAVQRKRVMSRAGMTEEKLRGILKRQLPDREKRRRADYVIPTGKGIEATERHLKKILQQLGVIT